MRQIIGSPAELGREISEQLRKAVEKNPNAAFGFAAVDVPREVYAAIAESGVDFSGCAAFNCCDYVGEPRQLSVLKEELFDKTPFASVHTPVEGEDYDAEIRAAGGLEIVVLGVGERGHVAFCEPGVDFGSNTYVSKLAEVTRKNAAEDFGGLENVPTHGLTMGMGTLMNAKHVFLVACGEDKANAVLKTLTGRPETFIPASFLQLHMDVEVYLDEAAASKL